MSLRLLQSAVLTFFVRPLVTAFSTYSRIPMPRISWSEDSRRYAMCFFPLIGLVISLVLGIWLALCDSFPIGSVLRGCVGASIPLLVTGGIHMDGLMDTADARASWQGPERRLEILKDPHTGAFAVIHCALYLLLMAGLLSEANGFDALRFFPVFVLSRALTAFTLVTFRSARPGGMLDQFASASHRRVVLISCAVYGMCCMVYTLSLFGIQTALLLTAGALLGLLGFKRMAYKSFGGITGDLAGWYLQITELVLCAMLIFERIITGGIA